MISKEQATALLKKSLTQMSDAEKRQLAAAIKLVGAIQKPNV